MVIALAAIKGWSINQMDVTNAFLYGDIYEERYICEPRDGEHLPEKQVCRFIKSLYGLKQASRLWFHKFLGVLLTNGFTQSYTDPTLFVQESNDGFLALLVYVDDILLVGDKVVAVDRLKQLLAKKSRSKTWGL